MNIRQARFDLRDTAIPSLVLISSQPCLPHPHSRQTATSQAMPTSTYYILRLILQEAPLTTAPHNSSTMLRHNLVSVKRDRFHSTN